MGEQRRVREGAHGGAVQGHRTAHGGYGRRARNVRKPRNVNRAIGDTRLSLSIWWRLLRSGRRKGAENERGKLSFLSLALLNIFARAVAPRPPRRTHRTLNTRTHDSRENDVDERW